MLRVGLVNAVWCPGVRVHVLRFSEYHVQRGGGGATMSTLPHVSWPISGTNLLNVDFPNVISWPFMVVPEN